MQLSHRSRDFILYVSIGVTFVGGILLWVVYVTPHYTLDAKWPTLAYFSIFLFGMVLRGYWHAPKSAKFWAVLLTLFVLHVLGYVLVLLRVRRLPPIWYAITFVPEIFIIGLVLGYVARTVPSVSKGGQHIRNTLDLRG